MKKIFTFFMMAMMTISVNAFDFSNNHMAINSDMSNMRQVAPISAVSAVAPSALLSQYTANGYVYDRSTDGFVAVDPWTVTADTVMYSGISYDVLYDVLPPGLFTNAVEFSYYVSDSLLIMDCYPLYKYNDSTYIFPMDYTAFAGGGYPNIILVLENDGSLHLPVEYADHVYGYFAATMDTTTYAPVNLLGAFVQYAGMTYSGVPAGINNMHNSNKAAKQLIDGRIIIKNDKHSYNVLGIKIQ